MLFGSTGKDEIYAYNFCINCKYRKEIKEAITKFKSRLKNTTYKCKYEEQCKYAVAEYVKANRQGE